MIATLFNGSLPSSLPSARTDSMKAVSNFLKF